MMAGHRRLAVEPWCYTPDVIANLTWQQVDDLYLKQAKELMDSMDKTPAPVVDDECPTWTEFCQQYGAAFIGKPESEMRKAYDSFLCDFARNQSGG
jgi:hypothetical protein